MRVFRLQGFQHGMTIMRGFLFPWEWWPVLYRALYLSDVLRTTITILSKPDSVLCINLKVQSAIVEKPQYTIILDQMSLKLVLINNYLTLELDMRIIVMPLNLH